MWKKYVDECIEDVQQRIVAMRQRAAPYEIPEDYIFFLEYYGGLAIDNGDYYFSTFGIGTIGLCYEQNLLN